MITIKKATKKEKKVVYEWICKSQIAEEKRYSKTNLNIFYKPSMKADQQMIYDTLEKQKYLNRYLYYLAYEKEEIVGVLSFVHILREDRNYLRIIDFFAERKKNYCRVFQICQLQ